MKNKSFQDCRKLMFKDKFNTYKIARVPKGFVEKFEEEFNSIITYMKLMNYKLEVNEGANETIWPPNDGIIWLCFSNDDSNNILNVYFYLDNDGWINNMEFEHRVYFGKNEIYHQMYKSSKNFINKLKVYIFEYF